MKPTQSHDNRSTLPVFDLLSEVVPGHGCFGHIPALPGLCFRGANQTELERTAPVQIKKYADWLIAENLTNLNPVVNEMTSQIRGRSIKSVSVSNTENVVGSPVWISGNPAVLFDYDLHPLEDTTVLAHLRFTKCVLQRICELAEALPTSNRKQKPDPERRSIDEMLTHIGNCVWWYCSRIDDNLPEPDERSEETQTNRIKRLLDMAEKYLISIPLSQRNIVFVPARFLTSDPSEEWTHTKVCRRQAEHAWEHLSELIQILGERL